MAKHHREDAAGRGAVAELLLARELQRSSIGKTLLAGALWRSCCWPGGAAVAEMLLARALWRKQLARVAGETGGETAGENSRKQQTGNGHLTEQARSVNLANQAQGVNLAELVRLSFWQRRCVKRSGREKGIIKKAASRRGSKLAA